MSRDSCQPCREARHCLGSTAKKPASRILRDPLLRKAQHLRKLFDQLAADTTASQTLAAEDEATHNTDALAATPAQHLDLTPVAPATRTPWWLARTLDLLVLGGLAYVLAVSPIVALRAE